MLHSTFSPVSMSAEQLERTFVQREGLAKRLADVFAESALSESKHHVLLVGPRGIGKSHLVSLVYHRLKSRDELEGRLVFAYLREDEWGITSFLDLLLRILRELGADTTGLIKLASRNMEEHARNLLSEHLRGKTLLVILENLDSVLCNLGEEGQKKWRSLIQNRPCWAILATTPTLSADISKQASPLYGFFEIHNLEGLTLSEAITLLKQLALSQGNKKVADDIVSPTGRARIRAVQHLANGNHRIFIIFYDFLANGLDEGLVEPLLKTIDALTPYYQSQMKELSVQQRKLVEFLCEYRGAANVKTIASRCFVSHQTAASQLKQLLERRYVRVTRIGRESYYELNEPLMRVCVEAKCHSGEPIRLLVEFLRYWFPREELTERLACTPEFPKRAYFEAALREYDDPKGHDHLNPEVAKLCVRLSLVAEEPRRDKTAVTAAAQELAEVSKIAEDWVHYTIALSFLGRDHEALQLLQLKADKSPKDVRVLHGLARAYMDAGKLKEALVLLDEAISLKPDEAELWMNKGNALEDLEDRVEALHAYSQALRADKQYYPAVMAKSRVLSKIGKHDEAESLLQPLLKNGGRIRGLFTVYGCVLAAAKRVSEALTYFQKATKNFPNDPQAWRFKGQALLELNRPHQALTSFGRAMRIAPGDFRIGVRYCKALFTLRQHERALQKLPVEMVAHHLFHELLELGQKGCGGNGNELRAKLSELHSVLKGDRGNEALFGGLVEFASYVSRHPSLCDVAAMREWSEAISEFFKGQPRFAVLVRIFDVMVRYKESGDEKALLELPLEQRTLLTGSEPFSARTKVFLRPYRTDPAPSVSGEVSGPT